ncbi:MAG: MMPL family transporter [bacterium]|nr:MMPL family transporter [bacterium]
MQRYIAFVLKRPIPVILALIAITIILGTGIPKLKFDNSIDVMMPQHDSQFIMNEEIKRIYGNNGKFVLIGVTGENIWTNDFFNEMNKMIIDIDEYKDFNEEKEKARLNQFNEIIARESIEYGSLIKSYDDDPSFQRALIRKIDTLFETPEKNKVLDSGDLEELQKDITRSHDLKKIPQVDKVICPITAKDISGKDDTLQSVNLTEKDDEENRILPVSSEDFKLFKKKLTANPGFEKALYSRDEKTGAITDFGFLIKLLNVKNTDNISREIWDIANSYKKLSVTPQGIPIINKFMSDYMRIDLSMFLPLVLIVVIFVFFFNFRSFRGVVLPLITLILTDTWILGLMGHLGVNITIVGVSLPSLMIAVGSSYSIHILNQYYIDYDDITRIGKTKGLKLSMSHISTTVLLAGLTTFLGFISLISSEIIGVKEWGICSAIGVLFAVFITTSMIPAFLVLMPHKDSRQSDKDTDKSPAKSWIDPLINAFINISTKHYKSVLIITGLIIIVSIIGIFKMKVETVVIAYFKESSYVRTSSKIIGEKFGGSFGMSMLIDSGETNGAKDPEFLSFIEEAQEWLESKENLDLNIGRTDSFPDVIKSMHKAMNNDNQNFYALPDTKKQIAEYLEVYSGDDEDFDGRVDDFESYIDSEYRTALIFTKLHAQKIDFIGTKEMIHVQDTASKYIKNKLFLNIFRKNGSIITKIDSLHKDETEEFTRLVDTYQEWLKNTKNLDSEVSFHTKESVEYDLEFIAAKQKLVSSEEKQKTLQEQVKKSPYNLLFKIRLLLANSRVESAKKEKQEIETKLTDTIYALVAARVKDNTINEKNLVETRKDITAYLENNLPDTYLFNTTGKYNLRITGEPAIFIKMAEYVVQGQMLSLLFCLITVCIMVILLFKNWKAGFISLIPMSVAVIINFGIMGWFGIRLDTATAIIASITIGIGVDDTIHFLNTYRHFRAKKMSVDETIARTLAISGKAITYTSVALVFGFSVMITSNFKPIMYFGILVAITMIATTVGALLVLPAAIKATNVSLRESESNSLFWRIFYIGKYFNVSDIEED